MDREAWRAAIHGVTKSRTRLSDWTELKAVLVNYHTLGDSREQKFILSQFWIPNVINQGVWRALLHLKSLGESSSLLFQAFDDLRHSKTCGYISPISASMVISLISSVFPHVSLIGPLGIVIKANLGILDDLILKSLIQFHLQRLFPNQIIFTSSGW